MKRRLQLLAHSPLVADVRCGRFDFAFGVVAGVVTVVAVVLTADWFWIGDGFTRITTN